MVEQYQQQVRSRPARQQDMDVRYRPILIDNSGTIARANALIGLGSAISGLARDLQAVQMLRAENEAREAQNAYIEDLRQLRFDPQTGYLMQTGANAIGEARLAAEQAVDAAREARRANLSPAAQQVFDRATDSITQSVREQFIRHDGSELRRYTNATFEASAQNFLNEALVAYDNPEAREAALTQALNEIARLGMLNGSSPEAIAASQRAAVSQTLRQIISRMVEAPNGVLRAQAFFNENRERMSGEDQARVENALAPMVRAQIAADRVREAISTPASTNYTMGRAYGPQLAAGVAAGLAANPAFRNAVAPRETYTTGQRVPGTTMMVARSGAFVIPPSPTMAGVRMDISPTTARRLEIDATLAARLSEAATAVYGPGAIVSVFSGGQTAAETPGGVRSGSTRHDHGLAADVAVILNGRRLSGDELAPLIQYWRARRIGGVGVARGHLHLDLHTDRDPFWYYGGETQGQRAAIEAGNRGILPDFVVAMPPSASVPFAGPPNAPPGASPGPRRTDVPSGQVAEVPGTESLILSESGGNWYARNNVPGAGGIGHFGRLQFSRARLNEAIAAGVLPPGTTPEQFLAGPDLQRAVERWHFQDIDQFIERNGLFRFIGTQINGVTVTHSGMRAVAHLGGNEGLRRFLESGGAYNPSDTYGTRLLTYLRRHGEQDPNASAAWLAVAEANNAALAAAGLGVTAANQFIMQVHGRELGLAILQADPGTPLSQLLPNASPTITVGQYRAAVSAEYGTALAPQLPDMMPRPNFAAGLEAALAEPDLQLRQAMLQELELQRRAYDAIQGETRRALFDQAYQRGVSTGDWTIPPELAIGLGHELTAALTSAGRVFQQGVNLTDPVLYGALVDQAVSDPEAFLATDLQYHLGAGRLNAEDYRRLAALQTELRGARTPEARHAAMRAALDGVDPVQLWRDASSTFQMMTGINVTDDPTQMRAEDRAMVERFRRALEARVVDVIRATGSAPNRLELRAIVADMLTPVEIEPAGLIWGPTLVPRFDVENRVAPGATPRTVPVAYNDIPDSIRQAIGSQFAGMTQAEREEQTARLWNDMIAVAEGRTPEVRIEDVPASIRAGRVVPGWGEWVLSGFGMAGEPQYDVEGPDGRPIRMSESELLHAYAETRRAQILHIMQQAGITPDMVLRERQPHVYR
jgi:hypothetical protein